MKLKFETNRSLRFKLNVSRRDTLQDIKLKIESAHGFPVSSQTLSINGAVIANDADLHAARLVNGSRIHLQIADDDPTEPPPTRTADQGVSTSSSQGTPSQRSPNRGRRSLLGSSSSSINAAESEATEEVWPPPLMNMMIRTLINMLPPPPGNGWIIVWIQFGDYCLQNGVKVKVNENASQLRSAILQETKTFEVPDSYVFLHKNKQVRENRTFKTQKIGHRSYIEIFAPLHNSEFLNQIEKNLPESCKKSLDLSTNADHQKNIADDQDIVDLLPETLSDDNIDQLDDVGSSPANPTAAEVDGDGNADLGVGSSENPPPAAAGDDIMMIVNVKHGNETSAVEVWAGQKVARLRVKLGKMADMKLPEIYSFLHKGSYLLNEDSSFAAQNVADGDEIEIVI